MNFGSKLNKVKLQADRIFQRNDKTDVTGELREAEEQVEELRLLSDAFSRSVEKRLNTYSVPEEKKYKKVPENQFADTLKEALKELSQNQVGDLPVIEKSLIRITIEEILVEEQLLGKEVLEYEEHVEDDILGPLHRLLKDDFTSLAKQKKSLKQAGQDVAAKSKYRNSQSSMSQSNKLEICKEELEECESKLEQIRDVYACDLFSVLSKQRQVARLSSLFLEAKLDYFQKSLDKLNQVLPHVRKVLDDCPCGPVYGIPLHEHLKLNQQDIAVPISVCVRRMIEVGMREEGLLRMVGSNTKIKRLKGLFDAGLINCSNVFSSEYNRDYDIHVIAGAFKSYLRELPEPLLTHVKHDALIEAIRQHDHEEKLRCLWQIISALPRQNYNNLKFVIKFLAMIASYSAENKMTFNNISIVMAPNLIGGSSVDDTEILAIGRNMSLGNDYRLIVEQLIEYSDYFFKGAVDFGVKPRNPEPPPSPRLNSSVNGFTRTGSHRRTGSTDFNTTAGPLYPDCESPKQPHRNKKKLAPLPPQAKVSEELCSSPEQCRSKSPLPMSSATVLNTTVMSTSIGPFPAPRLHHSNSIKRPTIEPPKPPPISMTPIKPPRPSPPQVTCDDVKPHRPNLPFASGPIGFEKIDSEDYSDSYDTAVSTVSKSPSRSIETDGLPPPVGFTTQITGDSDDSVELRVKKGITVADFEFRKSLEGVLKHQPQAQPRHLLKNSANESSAPVESKSMFQLPAFPVPAHRNTKDGSIDRPEPIPRIVDKPVVPDKPSVIKSIVSVELSKPMVPEKPQLKGTTSAVAGSPIEESDSVDKVLASVFDKETVEHDSIKPNKPPKPNKPSLTGLLANDVLAKSCGPADEGQPLVEIDKKGDSTQL